MPNAKIKYNNRETMMGAGVTTFGRTSDNAVSFAEDKNISRYHAEIEKRGEEFWVIDLGSSNGTTVNGARVNGEMLLRDGDQINFGGTSSVVIEFIEDAKEQSSAVAAREESVVEKKEEEPDTPGDDTNPKSNLLLVAGATVGLAVVFAVGAGAFYYTRTDETCGAKAVIISPEAGDTITKATEIEIELTGGGCVERAIYTIGGTEIARSEDKPFAATLEPKDLADYSDGFEHNLQVVLEDKQGNKIVQPGAVALAFETREIERKPTPAPEIVRTDTNNAPKISTGRQVSLIDVQTMSKNLVRQFAGNFAYNVSNKQFLAEVQKKTAEYAQEGYFDRAAAYRDVINAAYVREQNLDAPLGFILAMSRSKFDPTKQGSEEGLWRMTNDFAVANAYNGQCGAETLSDPSQNCAAKASALYMKAIVFGVFDGDIVYSAAAFGKSPQDAGIFKAALPADRSDFWNAVKTASEREQIIRFFAAGIVAENPQKFGLKKDRPLSELYRVTM